MLYFGWSPLDLLSPCPPVQTSSTPITIAITDTFMLQVSFSVLLQGLGTYFSFPLLTFYPMVSRNGKVHYSKVSLFLLTITKSGCLVTIRWSVYISKLQRILGVLFSRMAQFRVDHLARAVMSSLILSLRSFVTFAYVNECFGSIST